MPPQESLHPASERRKRPRSIYETEGRLDLRSSVLQVPFDESRSQEGEGFR